MLSASFRVDSKAAGGASLHRRSQSFILAGRLFASSSTARRCLPSGVTIVRPVSTSAVNQPNAHTSTEGESFPVLMYSGSKYTNEPAYSAESGRSSSRARPKSPSRGDMVLSSITFRALKSLCMIGGSLACKNARPRAVPLRRVIL